MSTLEQELQESIKKNLPQQVGEVLKQRLEQADKDAKEVKTLFELTKQYKKETETLQQTIEGYKQFDTRNGLLDLAEKELEKERNKFEIEKLTYQLTAEKDKTEFSKSIALGLVRNTEYRKTIFDSENPGGNGVVDGQGNYHYPIISSRNYSETSTQE